MKNLKKVLIKLLNYLCTSGNLNLKANENSTNTLSLAAKKKGKL